MPNNHQHLDQKNFSDRPGPRYQLNMNRTDGNANQKVQNFQKYWPREDLQRGLKRGELIEVSLYFMMFFYGLHRFLLFVFVLKVNQIRLEW